MSEALIHHTAEVSDSAIIGPGSRVWHFAHVRENCVLGVNVTVGRGVYIGPGVRVGNNCKIQNSALIYEPSIIESAVFIGPGVILTNDQYPRATNSKSELKSVSEWEIVGVKICEGASIGAGVVCVAPVEIGAWSLVAAGSTVVKNVPAFALVAGTPAKWINWVGKAGIPLEKIQEDLFKCPKTGEIYKELDSQTLVIG